MKGARKMTVCDICEKEDFKFTKIQIGRTIDFDGASYELCKDCTKKLKKYIKFEHARQKGAKQ